ncbi:G-protein coupled receptor 183-like [Scyliorhinus canicula]|uniref:G-protein coupled receptor 183-like n=1 Tax=Scyliorhinus canicula TaxID=7830 RepID=UPI0018F5CF7B|nr:G-protein coupled receptor 183-like [Scyliorhinus canicula]XP_038674563.1 G-protein coupled receptor 183-like [Scyliorhinus canicula]
MVSAASYLSMNNSTNITCDVYMHHEVAKVMFSLFYIIILIVGLLGNILALHITLQKQRKINSTTLYLIHLAVSDTLFTAALPARIVYTIRGFDWPLGEMLCRISAVIFYINTYVSIQFMTCLSVDRYIAVVHPLRFAKFRKVQNVRYICGAVWVFVFIQTAPLLFVTMTKNNNGLVTCMEYPNFETNANLPKLLLGACCLGYCLPVTVILFCYSRVNVKLCKTAKENPLTEKLGRNKKAINVILLVLLAFLICFTPYHITIMQYMVRKLISQQSCWQQQVFKVSLQVSVCFMNLNCCIDPLIYFFAFKGYKRKVLGIIRRHFTLAVSLKSNSENNSTPATLSQLQGSGSGSMN